MKRSRYSFLQITLFIMLGAIALRCNTSNTANTTVIKLTGKLPVVFTWHDHRTDGCPECITTHASVYTTEKGDFDYDPLPFSAGGLTLDSVLAGYNRVVTVWVTDAGGLVIYRGVGVANKVVASQTNDPVTVELFPRGWYEAPQSPPGTNWELNKVRMTAGGLNWIVGWNNGATDAGIVYREIESLWGLQLPAVTSSTDWRLLSVDGAGSTAWAVGDDNSGGKGLILRYDGAIWNDDVVEPTVAGTWTLNGVSVTADGSGWAVGEVTSAAPPNPVVMRYQSGSWSLATAQPADGISLYDVFALGAGSALVAGKNNSTNLGYIAQTDGTTYQDKTPAACASWEIADVYAVSANDWWAVGLCNSATGLVIHYNGVTAAAEDVSGLSISGAWTLNGIWANSSGEAWAVGESDAPAMVLLHRSTAGVWTVVTGIENELTSWQLRSVDFSPDGMWGYAVGVNGASGLVLKYPFPQ